MIGWFYLVCVNLCVLFGVMLKWVFGYRFVVLGMLVVEMFKILIYLDVKIFNISNKNYLGIVLEFICSKIKFIGS